MLLNSHNIFVNSWARTYFFFLVKVNFHSYENVVMIPSGIGSYVDRFYVGIIILKGITKTSHNISQSTKICKLGLSKIYCHK